MATFGYARVSSADQNEDRQIIALSEQGILPERVFADKLSGKD
jgi:DNA invertase Pin-like site-specific DNA recombinase